MSQYKIEAGTGQHIGDRAEQQDRVALFTSSRAPGHVMAVLADGMGGTSGGALAAEQVIRTAKQSFDLYSPQTDDPEKLLREIASEAHTVIKLDSLSSEKKPHSTMVALVLTPGRSAAWAHVGDSRLYRFSGPNCAERTTDHSYVEKLVREGRLPPERAREHPLANVLVSSLGSHDHDPEITTGSYHGLKGGDSFLLCSDGLWQYLSEVELGAALAMNSPRQASELLIRKARERAAEKEADNCTLAVIKLIESSVSTDYRYGKLRQAI